MACIYEEKRALIRIIKSSTEIFKSNNLSVVIKAANVDNKFHGQFSEILDRILAEDQAGLDFLKDR